MLAITKQMKSDVLTAYLRVCLWSLKVPKLCIYRLNVFAESNRKSYMCTKSPLQQGKAKVAETRPQLLFLFVLISLLSLLGRGFMVADVIRAQTIK